jgi:hypothetical protein
MYSYEDSFETKTTRAPDQLEQNERRNRIPHSLKRQLSAFRVPPRYSDASVPWNSAEQNRLEESLFEDTNGTI